MADISSFFVRLNYAAVSSLGIRRHATGNGDLVVNVNANTHLPKTGRRPNTIMKLIRNNTWINTRSNN